jgi:glyoxylase-like metal-dependent hydrolase (beta-lactamase superfamily II)
VIGCWEVDGMLVDPGPESSHHTLLEKIGDQRPEAILLTHIHLDHAAATGAMVARWPDLPVYVHERGAPHIIDPSRLLNSAERLYGDKLEYLWGKIQPVPEGNVTVLAGGETVRGMRVAYTPGHASHHVCYLHEETGTAFVGDVAACRLPGTNLVIPPTPPPDIDVELWHQSLETVAAWEPARLAVTHFGTYDDVDDHIATMHEALDRWAALALETDQQSYAAAMVAEMERAPDATATRAFLQAMPPDTLWPGLDRYWSKKNR